jgi:hypothetical protein
VCGRWVVRGAPRRICAPKRAGVRRRVRVRERRRCYQEIS